MNKLVKMDYGYNVLVIQGLENSPFLTVKVRVKNNFPFHRLNKEFKVTDCKVQTNKVISYIGYDCDYVRNKIQEFTDLMLWHKLEQLSNNHKEHLKVISKVFDDYQEPW